MSSRQSSSIQSDKITEKKSKSKSGSTSKVPKGKGKRPAPNLNERLEGVQGWMAEIEKRQRLTTIIGAAIGVVAVLLGAAALTLALIDRNQGATQDDIDALNKRLDVIQVEVKRATEEQLQSVSDSIAQLRSEVEAMQSSGGGSTKKKGKNSKSSSSSSGAAAPTIESSAAVSANLSSPKNGALRYSPESLRVGAGQLTITYSNPSQMPHNVTIARGGKVKGKTRTFTKGSAKLSIAVTAGQYVFYCTVPGHRQAGMQGDLIVGG